MNTIIRVWTIGAVAGVFVVCVFGLPFACSPEDSLESSRRKQQLDELHRAVEYRREAREQVVLELIAQRRTLVEAIQEFQELDHEWPDFSAAPPQKPAEGAQERKYQHIRELVEALLHDRPEELAKVLRRLEQDYQQLHAGRPTPPPATERTEGSR
jgi:hypothetical protein